MNLTLCLLYLVPGAQFGIAGNDYASIEWLDARAKPTLAQCEAAWPLVQARDAADAQSAQVADANRRALEDLVRQYNAKHRTYIALTSPNATQRLEWEKLTARNLIAQNRLLLRDFSGTD